MRSRSASPKLVRKPCNARAISDALAAIAREMRQTPNAVTAETAKFRTPRPAHP